MDAGGKTIGLNIGLPCEQFPNSYITPELCFEFHYFFMRKFWFAYLSKALVAFPGGFGTLDEFSEAICLIQTCRTQRFPVILIGKSYWKPLVAWMEKTLVGGGYVKPEDLSLFSIVEEPGEAMGLLRKFYSGRRK